MSSLDRPDLMIGERSLGRRLSIATGWEAARGLIDSPGRAIVTVVYLARWLSGAGLAVDFYDAGDQVDDPVFGDAAPR